MQYPSATDIEALHRKYAPNDYVFDLVYTHCQIVAEIALHLLSSKKHDADTDLVKAGCMLHDIGVYAMYDASGQRNELHYITHGTEGERILRAEGFDEVLCRMASHHTGVGLTKEDIERQKLPLPDTDFVAETIEERLCMYADKFHSKSEPPSFNTYEYYLTYVAKFGGNTVSRFEALAEEFGKPNLEPLINTYAHGTN